MRCVLIEIPGDAVAQSRPHFAVHGGHAVAFDRKESREYKAYARLLAVKAMKDTEPIREAPVRVAIDVTRRIPRSFSKKKTAMAMDGKIRPISKPDVDNVAKAILDSFKSVVWLDDSQVVELTVSKRYGEIPGAKVVVTEVENG